MAPSAPDQGAETRSLGAWRVVEGELTTHQRRVFTAIVVDGIRNRRSTSEAAPLWRGPAFAERLDQVGHAVDDQQVPFSWKEPGVAVGYLLR